METKHGDVMDVQYQVHPTWWTGEDNSDWDRVKEALKRYWEQTKANLSISTGRDLHQTLADTVKQALGLEPLPLPHQPTPKHSERKYFA